MTTITNAPRLPGDQLAAPIVRVELLDDAREPVVGYVAGTAQAVQHRLQFAANGAHALSLALSEWELELEPNAQIEPAGTVYRITEQVSRGRAAVHIIEVPETGGPYTVLQTLIDEPGSLGSLLLTHLDDEFDAHDASAVSVAPIDGMAAEDVQAALAELAAQDVTEATDRAAADALLATTAALATETTARVAADTALATDLAAETTARLAADALLATTAALTTEATARAAADTTLTTNLTAEIAARAAADTGIVASVSTEATARAAADATLTTNLTAEAATRAAADTAATAALAAHDAGTTAVHGIANTAALVLTGDSRLSDTRTPTDGSVTGGVGAGAKIAANTIIDANIAPGAAIAQSKVANLTTDLAAEATARAAADTAATSALAAHAVDTTAIHGIADTTALVLTNDARLSDTRTPTDNSVTQSKVQAGSLGIDRLAVDPRARATHTGDQLAATISDLTTAIRANRLDQMAAPAAAVNLNGQRATNGSLPSASTDLITKEYADALRAGLLLKADPVRVMLDTNVNINAPGSVLDSIALSVDDRVLLTGQTSANDNGIYLWKGAAVPLVRASDADTSAEMRSGAAVWITAGTYDDQRWALTTPDPITLGVTNQTWTFDGGLAHVTAGAGLTKTGNRLDVGQGTGIEVGADTVGIAAGGVGTTELADLGVTTAKLANLGVTTGKVADLAVTTAKLNDLAVTNAKLAADAVTNVKVDAAAAIAQSKIANLTTDLTARALTPTGAAGTAVMITGNQEIEGVKTFRNANVKLRAEASTSAAPELHFYSINGGGTGTIDGLAWGIGIDVAAPIADRARDLAVFKAIGGSIDDAFYANNRGPLVATWAFGQAPADNAFKLSVIGSVSGGETAIAAGSDGASLPQATINVVSTAGFATAGQVLVETDDGPQWVTYTGVTGTSFTGCSLGTGTMAVGGAVGDINMGGIKVQMATTHRGPALLIRDSANLDRLMLMGDGTVKGAHELSAAAVCVEAHAVTQRPFAMRDIDGSKYIGFEYDGDDLLFRSFSSGTDFFRVSAADTAFEALTPFTAHAITADSILVGTAAKKLVLGTWGPDSTYVEFRNEDESATTGYALISSTAGQTIVNAETNLLFAVGGITNKVIHAGAAQTLGFFGQGPVAQPATPTTLGEVIAALQDLGLVA